MRKEKKNTAAIVMAWFVGIVMVLSVAGSVLYYSFGNQNLKYGKFSFVLSGSNQYITVIDGKRFVFNYFPSTLEDLNVSAGITDTLKGAQVVYVAFDPENLSAQDLYVIDAIRYDMAQHFPKQIYSGVLANDDRYPLPLMSCSNATNYAPMIVLENSNGSSISRKGYCIFMAGSQQDLLRAYERLLYGYYGVMP